VALFAIWAVHHLTRSRDREKSIFELYKLVAEALTDVKPVILKAWSEKPGDARQAAIAETKWRLQHIGGLIERIRRQSRRWAWRGIAAPRLPARQTYAKSPTLLGLVGGWAYDVWRWGSHALWVPGWTVAIVAVRHMAALREDITKDPFEDPSRPAGTARSEKLELIIGGFLQGLDEQLFGWMD
jgi:hypothetical protein